MEDWIFIKVILPLRLAWEPYYKTSDNDISIGMRVTVSFSGRKYVGVVSGISVSPDVEADKVREIIRVERGLDPISEEEIRLWKFISDYYLCTIGEVYRTAYPNVKTAGEKAQADAEQRHETVRARTLELYGKRLEKLRERLRKKDEEAAGKHNATVMARIDEARERITGEIKALEAKLEALNSDIGKDGDNSSSSTSASLARPECMEGSSAAIMAALAGGRNVLLEGGSPRFGHLFDVAGNTLADGRSVLMLVPDIELTKQLQIMLKDRFGDMLLVFNSSESAGSRRKAASILRKNDRPVFILGTRSALFLPFRNLGLVIVEEEHDPFYKQDGAPRYIARDTAVMLGSIHGAGVILSSPTPSLESLYNCISGRYVHILAEKDDGEVEIIDTTSEKKKGGMVGSLSRVLLKRMNDIRKEGGKVMMIRPWGPVDDLKDEVTAVYPDLVEGGNIEFCTVYEARRRDLEPFSLLAVIGTDLMLDKGDFRADERTMQTLEQFRARFNGVMLIQTRQSGHPVFSHNGDYPLQLLAERKSFSYPPYTRMIDIVVRDRNAARLKKLSSALAGTLKGFSPSGPFQPVKGKVPDTETSIIRIMLPKDRTLADKKEEIARLTGDFEKACNYSGHISIDVDPV